MLPLTGFVCRSAHVTLSIYLSIYLRVRIVQTLVSSITHKNAIAIERIYNFEWFIVSKHILDHLERNKIIKFLLCKITALDLATPEKPNWSQLFMTFWGSSILGLKLI